VDSTAKCYQLNSRFAHGVISDPTVSNATISPVLNNTVPNGLMTL